MSKRTVDTFIKVPRRIFLEENKSLSVYAKLLFVYLHELDMRYTGTKKIDYFYRSNEELANDLNISVSSVKRAKQELKDKKLISTNYIHWWEGKEHTRLSKKKVTSYRVE